MKGSEAIGLGMYRLSISHIHHIYLTERKSSNDTMNLNYEGLNDRNNVIMTPNNILTKLESL